ncbi:MAG: SusC/RagA family TonB-linked outer membrane protein [Bacteroidetes bacterium]|nr:SusC/RagA family TonB-linked outer membrane protein [Bacteroidota bacterium]
MKRKIIQQLLPVLFCMASSGLFAQYTVSGTVQDEAGAPLFGVNILIKGATGGTISEIDGKFSLQVPDEATELEFSYIGFLTRTVEVSRSNNVQTVVLSEDINSLEEVVVTGLATSVKRSNLANSVERVDASELTGIASQSTVDGALYGKFKGAEIRANSGAPGGGLSFRLRGTTSISGSSQPLIILDGVYIDNSSIKGGLNTVSAAQAGGSTRNQDNPSNRLADIDPSDIESIEILKGASTAAIYGSRAAGGVVIITTKKGEAGKTKVNFSQSFGQTQMLNPLGVRQWTEERVLGSAFASDIDAFRAAQSSGTLHNYEDELYGNKGLLTNTRLSISGGNDKTKFYIGGSYKNEEGIVKNTGYEKASMRINIDQKVSKNFDINMTSNFIHSSSDRGFFNNDNSGTTMGVAFTSTPSWAQLQPNENGVYPSNPYAPSNFLETAALMTNNESVNRFIGGGTATYKLFTTDNSSLKAIARGGVDFYNLYTRAIFPNTLQFERDGNGLNGVSVQGFTRNLNTNLAAFLVHNQYLNNGMSFSTSFGVTQENFDQNTILGTSTNLIGVQTNLDQAGSRTTEQFRRPQTDKGFFAQEEINFRDMVVATVGIRGDKSSNNGDVNKLYYYPKANIAFNIHNFDFWNKSGFVSLLKLRGAYGESGNFAGFGAKSTIMNSTIVNGVAGVNVPFLLGNTKVGPERQKELELGFDLGLGKKVGLDLTYYIKSVEDLLLNAEIPTSSGFSQQVTNAAELQNKGWEIGLNLNVLNTRDLKWDARFGWWKNNAEVTRLDVPAFTSGGFADFLGNFMIKKGYSPTTIIGVGPNPDVTLNGTGEPTLQVFGNAEPDFQLSWSNMISWKNFDFSMVWHWKQGGKNINLSALLFDLNENTYDFDDKGLDPSGQMTNGEYRLNQIGANTGPYVEDSGYIRLREVGLYYTIPLPNVNSIEKVRIGFSGNNLINIFDYSSYDPEVSNFGANEFSTGVEVTPFPSSKRWDVHFNITF